MIPVWVASMLVGSVVYVLLFQKRADSRGEQRTAGQETSRWHDDSMRRAYKAHGPRAVREAIGLLQFDASLSEAQRRWIRYQAAKRAAARISRARTTAERLAAWEEAERELLRERYRLNCSGVPVPRWPPTGLSETEHRATEA